MTQEEETSRESRRKHLLDRLEMWLNEALDEEEPPSGIAAEILSEIQDGVPEPTEPAGNVPTDLYSLWSAMTSLAQEVKLQGRAFKQLAELASTERRSREDAIARTAEKRARGDMISVLVDLRDRLKRGAESAGASITETERAISTPWLGRLRGRRDSARAGLDAVKAILKGYLLSLERLEEVLGELGLEEIDCGGELFDPHLMKAVDIEETTSAEDGRVLEVYRSGFLWDGEIFRPAEVKVARTKLGPFVKEKS